MNPRFRRLNRDLEDLRELEARSPFVTIQAMDGTPPEKYVLHLTCKGITKLNRGTPVYSSSHQLGIHLHNEYPRRLPQFEMLTPVYHPNIAQSGQVCIGDEGDHGWAPGMKLSDVIVRIIEIIRYENIGLGSPFNVPAAHWAQKNQYLFPLESSQIVGEALIEIDILDDDLEIELL